jgi:HK97 family phage major capsid protein
MSKLTELRERKAIIATQARAKIEAITDDMSVEDRTAANVEVDNMLADVDSMNADIVRHEAVEAAERSLVDVAERRAGRENVSVDQATEAGIDEERAFLDWMQFGMGGASDEARQMMQQRAAQMTPEIRAAMGTGANGAGFLIPENFIAKLEEAKLAFGGIRPLATIIKTANGAPIEVPTNDDTGATSGAILDEGTAGSETTFDFGQESFGTFMYHSGIVRMSLQLLEDSFFSFDGFLPSRLAKRIARTENAHYATGNGTTQPKGFLTGIDTVATAGAGVFTWEDLVELQHAIDPEHRAQSGFAISDAALKAARKMKDAEGKPIWVESTRVGEPSTILGKPYAVVQEMPGVVASATPIAYGNFKNYLIRDAGSPMMQRLTERYAEFLQVGFHVAERHGGFLMDAGDKPIKALEITA